MESGKKNITQYIGTAMVLHLLLTCVRSALSRWVSECLPGLGGEVWMLLCNTVTAAVCYAITAWFLISSLNLHVGRQTLGNGALPRTTPAMIFCTLGVTTAAAYGASALAGLLGFDTSSRYPLGGAGIIVMFFTSVVLAPVMEEFFFRGVILNALRPLGRGKAVIISALLFGITHYRFTQSLYAFAAGLLLGLFVYDSGSLLLGIVLHCAVNLRSYLFYLLSLSLTESLYTTVSLVGDGLFIILAVGTGIYLYQKRRHSAVQPPQTMYPAKRGYALSLSPALIGYLIVGAAILVLADIS